MKLSTANRVSPYIFAPPARLSGAGQPLRQRTVALHLTALATG